MFSNWSLRWISRAMVTPSLVTTGDPVIFSRMTLRPLGPRVDLTASASWSTPAVSRARASAPKRSSLAMCSSYSLGVCSCQELWDENRSTADPPVVQVVQRLDRLVAFVLLGVQRDLASLGEDH